MMIPCLLLLGVLLFGGDKLASSGYLWLILIGVCVVPHLWMMFKGHGGHGDADADADSGEATPDGGQGQTSEKTDSTKQPGKDEHKHGGCCR